MTIALRPSVPARRWRPCVAPGPFDRFVYLSVLERESLKQQQNAVFRHWRDVGEQLRLDAYISGTCFVLTLPDGDTFRSFHVRRYAGLGTETEAEMIPKVQQGAALVHTFAAATGRRCGEIENGST